MHRGNTSNKLLTGSITVFLISAACIAVLVALALVPFSDALAHQRWIQQRPHHYQVDVTWASGWDFGSARVEMRDNHLVKAVDIATGQPLPPYQIHTASYFGSIDQLFTLIDKQVQGNRTWRNVLAKYVPSLARWLRACTAPLGTVEYDTDYGYPTNIWYISGWCTDTFFTYSNVKITQFTPLP